MDAWTLLAVIAAVVVLVICAPAAFLRSWSWRAKIAEWRSRRAP